MNASQTTFAIEVNLSKMVFFSTTYCAGLIIKPSTYVLISKWHRKSDCSKFQIIRNPRLLKPIQTFSFYKCA